MGLLDGRRGLILGVANDRSLAWGAARALGEAGATLAFTYLNETLEKRVRPLAESIGVDAVLPCDVADDAQIDVLFRSLQESWGQLDFMLHAIAHAPRAALSGTFVETTRADFASTLDISAYSFVALARAARPLLRDGSSLVTLTYHGSRQVVAGYNVMGVAKAALEASVRYLAHDLGPSGIRVNAVSAGPVKTLAAAGVPGFRSMLAAAQERAPLRRGVSPEEVGKAVLYLCSDLSSGTTGEILYVDAGLATTG